MRQLADYRHERAWLFAETYAVKGRYQGLANAWLELFQDNGELAVRRLNQLAGTDMTVASWRRAARGARGFGPKQLAVMRRGVLAARFGDAIADRFCQLLDLDAPIAQEVDH